MAACLVSHGDGDLLSKSLIVVHQRQNELPIVHATTRVLMVCDKGVAASQRLSGLLEKLNGTPRHMAVYSTRLHWESNMAAGAEDRACSCGSRNSRSFVRDRRLL
jgi:hypothetical protein